MTNEMQRLDLAGGEQPELIHRTNDGEISIGEPVTELLEAPTAESQRWLPDGEYDVPDVSLGWAEAATRAL